MSSLKYEIETWAAALEAYDAEDWDRSLDLFSRIADNSKILTNIGLIYASLGEHEAAIESFRNATQLDAYLAIAYYQAGVSNFLLGQFEAAFQDFEDAFQFLRGNEAINYEQIGLKYQLYGCAVLFNQGVTAINYGDTDRGLQLLGEAAAAKQIPDHDVIDEAIQDRGEGYSVFSVPPGILYRPNEKKVANMASKDWMGKAKLISSTADSITEFAPTRSQGPRSAPVRPAPMRELAPPAATGITRSRSATAPAPPPTTENDRYGSPPRGVILGRSASTSARLLSGVTSPLPFVQPLALGRQKSMRNPDNDGFRQQPTIFEQPQPQQQRVASPLRAPLGRRPTLKLDYQVDLPPSPPRSDTRSPPRSTPPPPLKLKSRYGGGDSGLTDIYDDYLQEDGGAPLLSRTGSTRMGRKEPPLPPMPPMPTKGLQRNDTTNTKRGLNRKPSGSVSSGSYGEADDRLGVFDFELKKIRVKLYFQEEARGLVVSPNITFSEFLETVCAKFSYEFGALRLKFEDEDGTRVSLRDEGDWDMAVETARDSSGAPGGSVSGKPGEGRLMVWCEEDYR